jgi:hypothetical protein
MTHLVLLLTIRVCKLKALHAVLGYLIHFSFLEGGVGLVDF